MEEMIQLVAERAGISSAQAKLAVYCVFGYLAARLPSPVVGRIREQMNSAQNNPRVYENDGVVR